MNMIEKIARAICKDIGLDPDEEACEDAGGKVDNRLIWECWVGAARAAKAAMED